MHNILEIKSKLTDYSVKFISELNYIQDLIDQPNTILVIDQNVQALYPSLKREGMIMVKAEESTKTLQSCYKLLDILAHKKANINTHLIVVGGGVLQDAVGFCASIYSRGIQYTLVPTTLLAQADSCIGGKTSINFNSRKNLLGTFYPPKEIVIYTKFLPTLSSTDYISGLGEIFKFHILQGKMKEFDPNGDITNMIYDGLQYKADILSRDEFDKGERKFLNYGHTFGHALESISDNAIPHGIAVIVGCLIATEVARSLGYSVKDYELIKQHAEALLAKVDVEFKPEWFNSEELLNITKSDKKSTGELVMVLVDEHKPFLEIIKNIHILDKILKNIYESIRLCNTIS
jgi:3-dehydroquinate synthase